MVATTTRHKNPFTRMVVSPHTDIEALMSAHRRAQAERVMQQVAAELHVRIQAREAEKKAKKP